MSRLDTVYLQAADHLEQSHGPNLVSDIYRRQAEEDNLRYRVLRMRAGKTPSSGGYLVCPEESSCCQAPLDADGKCCCCGGMEMGQAVGGDF